MTDSKKGESAESAKKSPLRNRRVEVQAKPRRRQNLDDFGVARKAERRIREEVEKAIDEAEPDGSEAQLDAADRTLDEEKKRVPAENVRRIRVKVDGNRTDERGKTERVSREREVEAGD